MTIITVNKQTGPNGNQYALVVCISREKDLKRRQGPRRQLITFSKQRRTPRPLPIEFDLAATYCGTTRPRESISRPSLLS